MHFHLLERFCVSYGLKEAVHIPWISCLLSVKCLHFKEQKSALHLYLTEGGAENGSLAGSDAEQASGDESPTMQAAMINNIHPHWRTMQNLFSVPLLHKKWKGFLESASEEREIKEHML